MKLTSPVVAFALVAAACGGYDPVTLDHLPVFELREEWRLSSAGPTGAAFSSISDGSIVLPDGRLVALDAEEATLRVFAQDGTLEKTFGRRGDGPGDFLGPAMAGQLADTIWVFDRSAQRIQFFDSAFNYITVVPAPLRSGRLLGPLAGGFVASRASDWLFVYDRAGQLVDSSEVRETTPRHRIRLTSAGEQTLRAVLAPFSAIARTPDGSALMIIEPSELWGGKPGQVSLQRLSFPERKLSDRIVASLPAEPVFSATLDSASEALFQRFGVTDDRIRAEYKRKLGRPRYAPGFAELLLVAPDQVWLSLREGGAEAVVVRNDGTPDRIVQVAPNLVLLGASGDALWALQSGEEGASSVAKYRLVRR
jgi:hypothetical protein